MTRFICLIFILGFSQVSFSCEYEPKNFSYHDKQVFYDGKLAFTASLGAISKLKLLIEYAVSLHTGIIFNGVSSSDGVIEESVNEVFINGHFFVSPQTLFQRRAARHSLHVGPTPPQMSVELPPTHTVSNEDLTEEVLTVDSLDEIFAAGTAVQQQSHLLTAEELEALLAQVEREEVLRREELQRNAPTAAAATVFMIMLTQ